MKSFIRVISAVFIIFCWFAAAPAQTKPARKTAGASKPAAKNANALDSDSAGKAEAKVDATEKAEFEAAQASPFASERIEKLREFVGKFPRSSFKTRALELLVSSRAELGETLLRANDATGVEQFKQAITDAPANMSDKLFVEVASRIPANLFFRGQREAALEVAKKLEAKVGDNAGQLVGVAQFYLTIEDADNASRLATRAAALKPDLANAHIALGFANRINLRLDAARGAFARALELDPKSIPAKRALADSLRGLGQAEEAAKLYREILAEASGDQAAQTGLALALFGSGSRAEAETQMNRALAENPRNYQLLASAAYWYAAQGDAAKAVELGQKAVAVEPRYTWAHIALARGLLLEKRPLEAERALLVAKQYGNFPTLDYELANARFAAGFYDEAAQDLRRSFRLKNGVLETKLAGRVAEQSSSFVEILEGERRAAILQPVAAETEENAARLKKLLAFANAVNETSKDEAAITQTAQDFAAGEDAARSLRQLYAADRLLKEKIALAQVLELTQAATGGVDQATETSNATSAVLAEELVEPRRQAAERGSSVDVPGVEPAILNKILRGRIEEIAGWTLYNQDKTDEAIVRLKRAVSILPAESAPWRSSWWRLGAALEKNGLGGEALGAYIRSYRGGQTDETRLAVIKNLYERMYKTTEGLDERLNGKNPAVGQTIRSGAAAQSSAKTQKNPLPDVIAQINPVPQAEPRQPAAPNTPTQNRSDASIQAVVPAQPKAETAPETSPTPVDANADLPTEPAREAQNQNSNQPIAAPIATPAPEVKTEASPAEKTAEETTPKTVESKTELTPAETRADSAVKIQSQPIAQPGKPGAGNQTAVAVSQPRVLITDRLNNTVTEISPKTGEKTEIKQTETPATAPEKPIEAAPQTNGAATDANESSASNEAAANTAGKTAGSLRIVNPADESNGEVRQRVVQPESQCAIWTSQSSIVVPVNGNDVSVLVAEEGTEQIGDLTGASSSPADVEVALDPQIGKIGNRALFQIRSTSEKTGLYTITFQSSCGKKEVKVRVK